PLKWQQSATSCAVGPTIVGHNLQVCRILLPLRDKGRIILHSTNLLCLSRMYRSLGSRRKRRRKNGLRKERETGGPNAMPVHGCGLFLLRNLLGRPKVEVGDR